MASAVTKPGNPMEEFQTRVVEKLRADIGAMLPDEVLAQLTARAVEEQFFKPRKVVENSGSYHERTREAPSWFLEEVAKTAKPQIERLVVAHVAKHSDQIERAVNEFLAKENLMLLALSAVRVETQSDIMQAAQQIVERIRGNF